MKIKKEYLILCVIILALSLYLIFHNRDRSTYQLPALSPIERNDITRIEILGAEKTIELGREGSDWKILPEAYPADAAKIKDMLDVLTAFTLTALVSESENYQIYDLDDEHRIRVKAWSKDSVVREFDAGKAASSFRHTFVKLPGNPMVYHARDNFRRKFDLSTDDLRDKLVLSFDAETIHEIEIQKGALTSIFSKNPVPGENAEPGSKEAGEKPVAPQEQRWMNEKNELLDEPAIRRLLSTLSGLKCEKYIEGKTKAEFSRPICTILLKGAKDYSLSLYDVLKENVELYPAVSSENPYVFLLPKWRVENIMKDPADMVAKKSE
jgi:hypothetical protein